MLTGRLVFPGRTISAGPCITSAAEKASATKSDFLAKVSHEIRTPLNSIIGFAEVMLEERFGPIGNERYRDYLKDIRGAGDHVVALINDLLDLAKIEQGKLELSFADLNLNELVQDAVTLMQPQANRERIIIRTSLGPGLRPVVADARALRQVVLNLLSNSIKFTGGGGQVIVSTAQSDSGDVVLRVRDTGIGMDEKELRVAWEPGNASYLCSKRVVLSPFPGGTRVEYTDRYTDDQPNADETARQVAQETEKHLAAFKALAEK